MSNPGNENMRKFVYQLPFNKTNKTLNFQRNAFIKMMNEFLFSRIFFSSSSFSIKLFLKKEVKSK